MRKIRFLWNNLFDEGTVTASNSAVGFPVSCLKNRWHTRHWRSENLANEWVMVDLGAPKAIQALVIKYHNFPSGNEVRIQAHADPPNWGAPTLNEVLTITDDQIVKVWETAQTFQWWRILMVTINAAGYQRMGRIYLGSFFEPTYDVTRAPKPTPVDPSIKLYSDDGQISTCPKTHYKKISFEFEMIPNADKATFDSIFDHVGVSKPYFICRDADDAATTTYYVQNSEDFDYTPKTHGWWSLAINTETMR